MAAGLFLVTALYGNRLADGFPVGNPGIGQNGVGTELGGQLVLDHVQMEVALAGDNGLGGFCVLLDFDGWIFFHEAGQAGEDLVFFALLGGGHGLGQAGNGILDGRITDGVGLVAERIAGSGHGQLADGGDVAGDHLVSALLLFAAEEIDAGGLFSLFRVAVVKGRSGGKRTGADADQGQFADKGVSDGLKDKGREGLVHGSGPFDFVAGLGIDADVFRVRGGMHGHDRVEQGADTNARQRGNRNDGNDVAALDAGLETGDDLIVRELFAFQVLHHQLVVFAGGGFRQFGHAFFNGG